jgi:transposase
MALQRLCCPGSDLQGSEWIRTVEGSGFEAIELQHLYRTTGFLAEVRDDLERELFDRDRDLFTQSLDLVFIDTTSIYVYRTEETDWRLRGYSRDHRPDLPQMVLAVAVDRQGWPVSWEVFPGNTADHKAFEAMIQKMRQRFSIRKVIIVADRGMISQETLRELESEQRGWKYILGARMRKHKEVREKVLSVAGRYRVVHPKSKNKKDPSPLKVKDVVIDGRQYVVCMNEDQAQKDAADLFANRCATRLHGFNCC